MGEFALGQAVPRFEDPRLLRGGGRYVDDMVLPRMAFGHVLRSPHAHARIRSIDATAAKAAPGVLAVLTGADWEASGWGDLPSAYRATSGATVRPPIGRAIPALVKDRVRWVGDYVAFVVAESAHQAADAAELIAVEYEPMPAIVSTAAAMEPGAPRVWDDCPDNISFVYLEGDKASADAAFDRAAHIVRHRFVINRVTAATMEPRGCIGDYNPAADHYTIYTTLQRTHAYRSELARQILKVPGKQGARRRRRHRRQLWHEVGDLQRGRAGVARLEADRAAGQMDEHAHRGRSSATPRPATTSPMPSWRSMPTAIFSGCGCARSRRSAPIRRPAPTPLSPISEPWPGVYRTPAVYADVTAVYTNTNPMRAYRGNGRPEAAYVIERMVDLAADELGIDPIELRRRNMIPPEAMPFKSGLTFTYDCGEFEKSLDMALDLADFAGFEERRAKRAGAANCAASASRTRSSAPRPAGSKRRKSASTAPAP